tara:strand:+ start:380 stop:622 length:243 start_codon:yes stop_codon:yes gene_type:complete
MSSKNNEESEEKFLKDLVLARIDIMPQNFKLSIGNKGTFNKEQIMESVKRGDQIGKQVIDMQINFIKALTSGELTRTIVQ